jgi:phenylacetate-CoA ligase
MPDLEKLYRATPVWLQNALVSVQGWRLKRMRFGVLYPEVERRVEARWSLHGQALVDFQAERLSAHLRAAQQCPFWKETFSERGVRVQASDPFSELAKLPVLTKRDAQHHASGILNPSASLTSLRSVHTSGTTGAGLVFHETPDADLERWAVWWRYRKQFGLDRGKRCGHFGGRSVVPLSQQRPPFWRYNYPGRQLLVSAYHLSEDTVESYWRALNDYKVEWLHGYPSFLSVFAKLCLNAGLGRLPHVRWITTGAENLLPSQRRSIESGFAARVRQHYGMAEAVANISERIDGRLLVDEDFSYVEFVPDASGSSAHRIIGTNWSNHAFPLFRYDTGDLADVSGTTMPACGTWREVYSLDGRSEDFVVLPNGARVGRLDHVFKDLVHVSEAQIYQRELGGVVIRIVKGSGYDVHDEEARLLAEARQRLGYDISIQIEYTSEIPRTASGKLRFVVSDLPKGQLAEVQESRTV